MGTSKLFSFLFLPSFYFVAAIMNLLFINADTTTTITSTVAATTATTTTYASSISSITTSISFLLQGGL